MLQSDTNRSHETPHHSPPHDGRHTQLFIAALLVAAAWLVYYPCLDNYFTWDDFIWLMKVKSLSRIPTKMFTIEAVYGGSAYYFDPLVYLSFGFDYLLAGLNFRWYHAVDIMLHAANSMLVFLTARTVCRETTPAVTAALLFVSSFAIVDTAAWSSSRVDLFAVLFSLLSLFSFVRFLHVRRMGLPVMSILWFALSLCAKGTPIVLPLPLLGLLVLEKRPLRDYRILTGHVAVAALYLVLLIIGIATLPKGAPSAGIHLNGSNILVALQSMVIPEARLAQTSPLFATLISALLLLGLLLAPATGALRRLTLFGLALLVAAMLPLLIIKDFNLVTDLTNAGHLLTSPSHRIYLAYTGMAFIMGGGICGLTQRLSGRWSRGVITATVLLPLVAWNIIEARERELLWDGSARLTRSFVEGFMPFRSELRSNTLLVLVNPPISRSFTTGALNVLYGIDNPLLMPIENIPREIIDSPDIFPHRHQAGLFLFTGYTVKNFSNEFRELADISFRHLISTDPAEKTQLLDSYLIRADHLNTAMRSSS